MYSGDTEVSVTAVTAGNMTYNGKQLPAETYRTNCASVVVGDNNDYDYDGRNQQPAAGKTAFFANTGEKHNGYAKMSGVNKEQWVIEVKNVKMTYGKKQHAFVALEDINFIIPDGASVAILGKSGSGKSTLMHAMSGLDRPEQGQVLIDGQDILTLKEKQIDIFRANKIGFIFQSFFVQANETVSNNVSLPLEIAGVSWSERKKKIRAALESVDLIDKINNKAKNLSGGQKQRLAVARAIVNEPNIIFADEPTGNLDSVTGEKVEDMLFGYNKENGVTLIIVTHDPDLAAKCDIQINIKDGRVESIRDTNEVEAVAEVVAQDESTSVELDKENK